MDRAIRMMHIALLAGLVSVAGVFGFLRHQGGMTFGFGPSLGIIVAAVALVAITIAVGFLAPRVPRGSGDQSPEDYWRRPETRGAAIILWAMVEGAGVLSWMGYLLTGAWVPAGVGLLAIIALALLRPAAFDET